MANEIDKTIEELEQEVLSELEEAADAPKQGAAPSEPQLKASDASSVTPGGEVQDMGPAVTHPSDKSGPGTKAGKKAKEKSGDAAQKKELKPETGNQTANDGLKKVAKPLAAGDTVEVEDGQEVISEKEEVAEMDKMEMVKAMKDMTKEMSEMGMEELKATYDKMKEMMSKSESNTSEEDKEKEALQKEAVEQRIKSIDVQEHVEALMSGEGDLYIYRFNSLFYSFFL